MLYLYVKWYMSDTRGKDMDKHSTPKLIRIPTSVRIPEDIKKELPYIAVFNHKTSTAEQVREWIIDGASKVMNTARYEKFKKQMEKIEE